ncbi:hypothetical protein DPMN_047549 [Dreissena polymorpha]|uniref:Uncharacterized protein n=1 Tax=Dreissena polymorpha TaxID=45954 RepID=A0A9D4D910_DREPO|nr:hypothetical protein DPMN_047549 [Dreissena polymorpha]
MEHEVRKKMKKAKETWIEEQFFNIFTEMSTGRSKKADLTLKTLTKTSQPKISAIADVDGNP